MANYSENRFIFTEKKLNSLETTGKKYIVYDQKEAGLGLSVSDTGFKSYVFYKKVNGKPKRKVLGRFPDLDLSLAREKVLELRKTIANTGELEVKPKIEDKIYTFRGIYGEYLEKHSKLKKKRWDYDIDTWTRYIEPNIDVDREITTYTRREIEELYNKIAKKVGTRTANITYTLLSSMFNKAINWDLMAINLCKGIQKYKDKSRERFLQPEELKKLLEVLNNEKEHLDARDFIFMCLLTGARRGNVLAMKWEDISFQKSTWSIPETKNGDSLLLPLVDKAIEILKERKKEAKSETWVFPSPLYSLSHMKEPRRAWKKFKDKAGIKDLWLHDLRRTVGSYMAASGNNSFVIGKALGHKSQASTAVYARLNVEPVREALEQNVKVMFK